MNVDEFRLSSIDEFVGQTRLLNRLTTHIGAAVAERRPLEHLLLAGRPGFGKTALATLVADLLEDPLEILVMPVSDKALQAMVASHDGVLLLDEVHAAPAKIQEMLLPLLEFGYIQTRSGYRIEAGFLTIIGATTEPQNLLKPLYDRFRIKPVFEDYTEDEMAQIVMKMAIKGDLELSEADSSLLGRATGGTPRNAAQFVVAGRALGNKLGHSPSAAEILEFCDTDLDGLDRQHYKYLETLAKFGGTRGLAQIATVMRLNPAVVMEVEALLFSKGFINFGTTGRELTSSGYQKVKGPPRKRADE